MLNSCDSRLGRHDLALFLADRQQHYANESTTLSGPRQCLEISPRRCERTLVDHLVSGFMRDCHLCFQRMD